MSEKLPNMLETTIQKIRDMVDANTVVGQPITTSDALKYKMARCPSAAA